MFCQGGGPVGGDDTDFIGDAELLELFHSLHHNAQIAVRAHDHGNFFRHSNVPPEMGKNGKNKKQADSCNLPVKMITKSSAASGRDNPVFCGSKTRSKNNSCPSLPTQRTHYFKGKKAAFQVNSLEFEASLYACTISRGEGEKTLVQSPIFCSNQPVYVQQLTGFPIPVGPGGGGAVFFASAPGPVVLFPQGLFALL